MLKLIIWLSTLNHTPYSFLKCSIFTKVLVILISRHNYLRQFPDFERKKISDKDEGGGGGDRTNLFAAHKDVWAEVCSL